MTVDLSNPDEPTLISGSDTPAVNSGNLKTVTNGSGLALIAGGFRGLEVHDATDAMNTYNLLRNFETPGTARSVTDAGGIAFIADGLNGLQLIRYADIDTANTPPSVTITTDAIDVDPATPGIQVVEGTTIAITPTITDDVQVQSVELFVDGERTAVDVSFPFDFTVVTPNLAEGVTSYRAFVKAFDTGGNTALSDPVDFTILEDTTGPILNSVSPEGLSPVGTQTVELVFDESLDITQVGLSSLELVDIADPGAIISPIGLTFRGDGRVAQFTYPPLGEAVYQLRINQSQFRDRAGNASGSGTDTRQFEIVEATSRFINPEGGFRNNPNNWSDIRIPGPDDTVLIDVNEDAEVTVGNANVKELTLRQGSVTVTLGGVFEAQKLCLTGGTFDLMGARLRNTVVNGSGSGSLVFNGGILDGVTLNIPLLIRDGFALSVQNGLTLNSDITLASTGRTTQIVFNPTQTLDGTGQVIFGGSPATPFLNRIILGSTSSVVTIGDDITIGNGHGQLSGFFDLQGHLTPGPTGHIIARGLTSSTGVLNLDAPDGGLELSGTLTDIVVAGTPGTQLLIDESFGLTLDGVTLRLPTVIENGEILTFLNGLTLDNTTVTLASTGQATDIRGEGTQAIDGTGQIVFGGSEGAFNRLFPRFTDDVLTIGEDITVVGVRNGQLGGGASTARIVVLGTLRANLGTTQTFFQSSGVSILDVTAGRLVVEIDSIGGEPSGKFTGAGEFGLPATLQVERPTGFVPSVGDSYDIFEFGSLADAIDQVLGDIVDGIQLLPTIDEGILSLVAQTA